MITTAIVIINGKEFKRTVSDLYKIRKVGTQEMYSEAYDLLTSEYEYEETTELLEENEEIGG